MYGWHGKILVVDLGKGEISSRELDKDTARKFIGGRGLGVHFLLEMCDPACDPLGPDNVVVMSTGPLTGTKAPTGARYMVTTKSPLTGAITCSNSGGKFPAEFKKTGWDAVIFTGKSPKPVYLWLHDDQAELRPARHLWGTDVPVAHRSLINETHPKAKTAVIGRAGENLVLMANVMNDLHRAAGRSGVGAVLGSKNLKGLVVRGTGSVRLADPEGFDALVKGFLARFKDSFRDAPPPLRTYGTAVTVNATNAYGVFPTRNFQQGTFAGADRISGEALTERFLKKAKACHACPLGCGRGTAVEEGPYRGEGEGPEYETIYSLGSDCGNDDLAALTKANYICNETGMDTISMGSAIACAMELAEKGYLPEKDVGFKLGFGDADAIVKLCEMTAERKGFGDALARGSLRLARQYGHPELAMVSKSQDFAGYDPRGEQGMGLAYATSPVGASHMRGDPAYFELLGVPLSADPHTWKDKPPVVKQWQDVFSVIDAAGLCVFFSVRNLVEQDLTIAPSGIAELLNAATGAGYTTDELTRAGERIFNAERIFLNKAGLDRRHDTLPPRITSEPLPDGPAKGMVCHLEEMLEPYYEFRGWDPKGYPKADKLAELGLA